MDVLECIGEFKAGGVPSPGSVATLFMAPVKQRDLEDLFGFFPGGASTATMLLRYWSCQPDSHVEKEVRQQKLELVERDIRAKAEYLPDVSAALVCKPLHYLEEPDPLRRYQAYLACRAGNEILDNYVQDMSILIANRIGDERVRSIYGAFYGVSGSTELQWALVSPLIGLEEAFSNYFELVLIGGDYVPGLDQIYVR